MGGNALGQIVTVLTAIVGVAIIAVLVSKRAQTPQVITSFWQGFGDALEAATGPVSGGSGIGGFSNTSFI